MKRYDKVTYYGDYEHYDYDQMDESPDGDWVPADEALARIDALRGCLRDTVEELKVADAALLSEGIAPDCAAQIARAEALLAEGEAKP